MRKSLIYDFRECEFIDKKYAREPVMAKMADGTLVCVMLTGGKTEPRNENFVAILRSFDDGETWNGPEVLFKHEQRAVWATEIYMGFEKPMMVLYTYNAECPYKELQTYVSYTEDNGRTWSVPETMAPYTQGLCVRKGIKLSNGETLFPVYDVRHYNFFGHFEPVGSKNFWYGMHHNSGVIITSDGGKTYTPYGYLSIDVTKYPEENDNLHLWEPNCVELEDGHILMYMRCSCKYNIVMSESFDYGRTWTEYKETDIPNADAKITLFKIKDTVFMVSNMNPDLTYEGRIKLQIQKSTDNCKTWEFVDFVDGENEHRFYPHVAVDEQNKTVYLAYENGICHYMNKYSFEELGA